MVHLAHEIRLACHESNKNVIFVVLQPPYTFESFCLQILSLLVSGVRELGNVVCGHIAALMNELKQMNGGRRTAQLAPDR